MSLELLTLVMGPCIPFLVSPDTELVGDSPRSPRGLDLNGVMDWETPEARVNCSLNSTLVLPFAATNNTMLVTLHTNIRRNTPSTLRTKECFKNEMKIKLQNPQNKSKNSKTTKIKENSKK